MKALKRFDFPESVGERATYDWAKLLDGGIYELKEGEDFQCKVVTFQTLARARAKKAGKGIKIAKIEGGLVIQATDKDSDESE